MSTAASERDALILIVEDSPTQSLKLQHTLERHDYRVIAAADGRGALALLETCLPTLVITDINMPEMDGYELCRRIKDDPKAKEIPVILLTSLSDPKDILRGLECGADNFVVKPYEDEFLLTRVQGVLANLELRRQASGQGGTEIFFAGHKYRLTSDRIHSIDLLLSTYETAVQKNNELRAAQETLQLQAEELREKNAQMHEDLEMARELQSAFLPRHYPVFPPHSSPERSAVQFCHRYSTTTELGGDFFDILALSETEAAVFICDVMGHGVRAALVTAIIRGLVEELRSVAHDPGAFLTEINKGLCAVLKHTLTPLFATACYVVADLQRGELRYGTAGHPAPFLIRRSAGEIDLLTPDCKAPALGVFEASAYAGSSRSFAIGDVVMLYTDGLFEVESESGALFDKEQLLAAVAKRTALPTPRLFDELLAEVKGFSAQHEFEDDMCLVGMDLVRLVEG